MTDSPTADLVKRLIIEKIDSGMPPPNAPSTIARKGFDHPLIETGELRDAVECRVTETENSLRIAVGFYDEENAKKALINNDGVPGKIPARPFLTGTIDENIDIIASSAANEFIDKKIFRR